MLCEFELSDQKYRREISRYSHLLSGLNLQNSACWCFRVKVCLRKTNNMEIMDWKASSQKRNFGKIAG